MRGIMGDRVKNYTSSQAGDEEILHEVVYMATLSSTITFFHPSLYPFFGTFAN